ncbi:MAG: flavodoxin [Oscillospiraceae bacterium]|jgi:flavodoxin short chain|nr:flavodoxin [Oscillospiraceae bacterium]
MSKVAVVYWSGTGNTQAMADFVAEGAKQAGAEVSVFTAAEFSAEAMDAYDALAFGCPSMGAEVLEEDEFEPMFTACKPKLKGKKIALFGSFGWGDGEWMREWDAECKNLGANLACDYVICNEAPDDEAQNACVALGTALGA